MSTAKRLLFALSTGFILLFFSEVLFWARWKPEDSIADYAFTWLTYSVMAFVILSVISLFRVKNIWALFLTGALFGWLTEGVVVQTMYNDFPLNISFTGLAWHAAITLLIGWYYLRKILLENKPLKAILIAGTMGFIWGLSDTGGNIAAAPSPKNCTWEFPLIQLKPF